VFAIVIREDIVINLFLILFLSGLVGFERERHNRPAGLRTHILVGVGSTILMMISISMNVLYEMSDAGRIASQVVSGVGFLGAGTIIKEGFSVKGLTTAASLWATSAIGLAVGANYYFLASVTTLMVIIALFLLNRIEFKMNTKKYKSLKCKVVDKPGVLGNITTIIGNEDVDIKDFTIERREESQNEIWTKFTLQIEKNKNVDNINSNLVDLDGLLELKWDNI